MELYQGYLTKYQILLSKKKSSEKTLQSLHTLFQCLDFDKVPQQFMVAEKAFIAKKYLRALELYMSLDVAPFFALRSGAFLADELGNAALALSLCHRALALFPKDIMVLLLVKKLYTEAGEEEKAEAVGNTLQLVVQSFRNDDAECGTTFSQQNVEELEEIFQERSMQELFTLLS